MRTTALLCLPWFVCLAAEIEPAKLKPFAPLPNVVESKSNPLTEDKIALGRMLYFEKRLSRAKDVSCNSCHALDKFGVDGEKFSTGFNKQKGGRNSPTVYNAAAHFVQFWDGRAADVEEQAKGPMLNPVEMAMPDGKSVETVLKAIPEYVASFKKAFPGEANPVTFNNAAKAIGAFERKLMTPSKWDKYLQGEKNALTAAEKAGFVKFSDAGCASCHMGALVGGKMYQKLGLVKAYPNQSDKGRYQMTKSAGDEMMFKVPSLRNIAKTAPYFHDGSAIKLDGAVKSMGEWQLGKQLSDADVKSITVWLNTLTGEIPRDYIKEPKLPKG